MGLGAGCMQQDHARTRRPHLSVSPSTARRHAFSPSLCAEVLCGVMVQIRLLITFTSV